MSHHPTESPSSAPAILKCAMYQSGEAGEAAERGTLQHAYLAQLLGPAPERDKVLGLLPEETEAVHWAYDYIRMNASAGAIVCVEQPVTIISEEDFSEISYGTYDAFDGSALYDYKSGEVRDYSAQFAYYALGVMQMCSMDSLTIHALYGKYKKVVSLTLTRQEAWSIVKDVHQRRTDPNRVPTPCSYCGWCAAKLTCTAVNSIALAAVKGYSEPLFETWHSSEITDPATMGRMLTASRIVKEWAESVEKHAKEMVLKQGLKVPGFTLQERSGTREVKDIEKAFALAGLPQEKFLACCKVQLTKLEEAFISVNPEMKKVEAKRALGLKLADCIAQGPSTKFLVKEKE